MRNFTIQREYVGEFQVVGFRPYSLVGVGFDQPRPQPYKVTRTLDSASHDISGTKFATELARGGIRALPYLPRIQIDYSKFWKLREFGNYLFPEPVRLMRVLGVATKILEWQDRDAFTIGGGTCRHRNLATMAEARNFLKLPIQENRCANDEGGEND